MFEFWHILVTVGIVLANAWYFVTRKSSAKKIRSVERPNASQKLGETTPRCNPTTYAEGIVSFPEPDVRTAYEVFEKACKRFADQPCLGVRPLIKMFKEEKDVEGVKKIFEFPQLGPYQWYTYAETYTKVHNFGSGLIQLGLKPKGFLAVYEETRMEWTIAMRGAFTQSMVVFTVYANLGLDALVFALTQGEVTHIVCNGAQLKMLASIKKQVKYLTTVIYTDTPNLAGKKECEELGLRVVGFAEVEAMGAKKPNVPTPPAPEDLACIMYTSGSTGVPKGVLTTHGNIVGMVAGISKAVKPDRDIVLHYLPLAHSMAFSAESVLLYSGARLGYGNPRTLTPTGVRECKPDLAELSPTIFIAVPTIFERIMHAVNSNVNQQSFLKKFIFNFARKRKLAAMRSGVTGKTLWDKILHPVRERLGIHRIRFMITGSAPLSGRVHDWVRGVFGAPLVQGYGLTETNSGGTLQMLDDFSNEQIGSPLSCSEWKLVDVPDMNYRTKDTPNPRGEIYLRGSTITKGYFKDQTKTDECFFSGDGDFKWFATGDIGMLLPDGSLKIIDRKKNLIKASHGEYIAIEKLESAYKNCPYMAFLMVFVDGSHFDCVLLGVPNKVLLTTWAKEKGLDTSDWVKLCNDKAARDFVLQQLQATARENGLRGIETVKNVFLLPDEWTPENEMLTAAMKLNRTYAVKKYRSAIDKMYAELEKKA